MAHEKDEKLEKTAKSEKPAKAEKASKQDKPAKKDKKDKVGFFTKIAKFFRDYRSEFKKLVWPTGPQLLRNCAVVFTSIIVCGAVLALLDFGFSQGVKGLWNLVVYFIG